MPSSRVGKALVSREAYIRRGIILRSALWVLCRHRHNTHWTKHPSRLKRDFGPNTWGDEGYAREELVAELGATFLCTDLELTSEVREDHASYMASWLNSLKNDNRAIFQAAAHAQRAVDYLYQFLPFQRCEGFQGDLPLQPHERGFPSLGSPRLVISQEISALCPFVDTLVGHSNPAPKSSRRRTHSRGKRQAATGGVVRAGHQAQEGGGVWITKDRLPFVGVYRTFLTISGNSRGAIWRSESAASHWPLVGCGPVPAKHLSLLLVSILTTSGSNHRSMPRRR
jgi:hypothetical protein